MPLASQWKPFNPDSLSHIPNYPGVFELADQHKHTVYIGNARYLRDELAKLMKGPLPGCSQERIKYFCFRATHGYSSELQLLMEEYQDLHHGSLPECNLPET